MDNSKIKKFILSGIKDLDKHDYIDICQLIKLSSTDFSMIRTTEKGTYIDLDKISDINLNELYAMINTKLKRIKS